jgi:predicted metalloprotease with PDZ domain
MKSINFAFFLLSLSIGTTFAISRHKSEPPINSSMTYELSMPEPNTHYFEVKIKLDLADKSEFKDYVDFKMATWTPGSYLIREYAKNVEGFEVNSSKGMLKYQKVSKNTWRVFFGNAQKIEVKYRVYANELSVRNAHLDDSHGYANGAAVFMFVKELMNQKSLLEVIPHKSFSKVSVALPEISKNKFEVQDFDTLVDSPIEMGNQDIIEFESMGVKHTIANYSVKPLNYDKKQVAADYKKVVEAAASVFGGQHPCKEYLFIVHHAEGIGGGLEHLNSTTCQTSTGAYENREKYIGFLGLIAHEYFHLWNVKRLRPAGLGPFDYENENYTNMLWVSEGFTSYYQNDILRRAGLIDEKKMLSHIGYGINSIENTYGNKVQSVTEASWDAWIKYYRPNENSNNSTVSYYTKGGVIANVLNMLIIGESNGQKSLDDVLRLLYAETYLAKNSGFTDDEFKKACEKVSGKDLSKFFENCIYGTEMIDYGKFFENVDIEASFIQTQKDKPWLGVTMRNSIVTKTERGSGAYSYGIYVDDEILRTDQKVFVSLDETLKNIKVGEKVKIEVLRDGNLLEYEIPIFENPTKAIKLSLKNSKSELALKRYKKWMHLD